MSKLSDIKSIQSLFELWKRFDEKSTLQSEAANKHFFHSFDIERTENLDNEFDFQNMITYAT